MQISQRSTVIAATLALVVCSSASRAQQPEPLRLSSPPAHVLSQVEPLAQAQAQMQTARGQLLDVDSRANRIIIKTETSEMTFRFNDQTKVTGAQKGVAGLATMTGSEATVMFRKDGQGNLATTIEVKAGATPKAEPPQK